MVNKIPQCFLLKVDLLSRPTITDYTSKTTLIIPHIMKMGLKNNVVSTVYQANDAILTVVNSLLYHVKLGGLFRGGTHFTIGDVGNVANYDVWVCGCGCHI